MEPDRPEALYRILDSETGWGVLGLNGALGHEVDGATDIQPPDIALDWSPYELLSGHVDCRIVLQLKRPVGIFGFMDGHSWTVPDAPVTFSVDGAVSGVLVGPGERTAEQRLQPGRHVLRMTTQGPKTRRYPVWAIREIKGADSFRIVIPTSNHYARPLRQTLSLLWRYWPDHPPVDVVHHEQAPEDPNVHTFYAGPQSEVSWCEAMARYLAEANDNELVLLLLDDYGLCQPVDTMRVADARSLMDEDLSVGAFFLTWMMLPSAESYPARDDIIIWPPWSYSVHTQAGLWRRSSLLRALKRAGPISIAAFEVTASEIFNRHEFGWEKHVSFRLPPPPSPSLFLDGCDKEYWPIGYHNLYTRGQPDPRHDGFLRDQRLASDEMVLDGNRGEVRSLRWVETIDLPVITLDDAITSYGCADYVKISVEGFEQLVLRGLSQRIPVLSFEFCKEGFRQVIAGLERLGDLGYPHFNIAYGRAATMRHKDWLGSASVLSELLSHPSPVACGTIFATTALPIPGKIQTLIPTEPMDEANPAPNCDTLTQLVWRGLAYPGASIRLHLGCGENRLPGYVNIDYHQEFHNVMRVEPDFSADITTLRFPPSSVDEVRLHHVFEHFSRVVALGMLIRWHSWLKPGGILHIETPDFEGEARAFLKALESNDSGVPLGSFSDRMAAIRSLEGDQSAPWGYHVGHWFAERYEQTLCCLGFVKIKIARSLSCHVPPLHNITVSAARGADCIEDEQLKSAYGLLWNSAVAEAERPTWQLWCRQLERFIHCAQVPEPISAHAPVPEL